MKLGCSSASYHSAFRAGRIDQREWVRSCAEQLEVDGYVAGRSSVGLGRRPLSVREQVNPTAQLRPLKFRVAEQFRDIPLPLYVAEAIDNLHPFHTAVLTRAKRAFKTPARAGRAGLNQSSAKGAAYSSSFMRAKS